LLIREGQLLKEYLIGTGGWAYFRVPRLRPLIAYSRIFNFVEVNSTFYQIPSLVEAGTWRKMAPADFQFSVRAHRTITHTHKLKPNPEVFEAFEKMRRICNALNAEILHLQAPPLFEVDESSVQNLRQLLASLSLGDLRLALEIRGTSKSSGLDCRLQRLMEDNNMIHSVDLSRDEEPAFDSDIVYSRLFGKGKHNIYQPTDGELAEIDQKAANTRSEKIVMSFHFVKMYKDAVRLKTYKQTGKFPSITNSIGIDSLEEVLSEDAKFPATKLQLMQNQGWKLFDLSETDRIHAAEALKELPEQTYCSLAEVVEKVGKIMR
jgi:uncharacterized protein YecE (DUF72 family)